MSSKKTKKAVKLTLLNIIFIFISLLGLVPILYALSLSLDRKSVV